MTYNHIMGTFLKIVMIEDDVHERLVQGGLWTKRMTIHTYTNLINIIEFTHVMVHTLSSVSLGKFKLRFTKDQKMLLAAGLY